MMRRQRGMNLIELMIGMFIFVVAFLGIVGIYPISVRAAHQGKEYMLGLGLADQLMEQQLSIPFSQQPVTGPAWAPSTTTGHTNILSTVNGAQQETTYNTTVIVTPQ